MSQKRAKDNLIGNLENYKIGKATYPPFSAYQQYKVTLLYLTTQDIN